MGFFGCEESGIAFILVLFILLVIIACACEN
ncbi:YjcZ family sporulation protein [Aneurinibacillus sp. Ricciae_BoGa-3]|nr:YjcZ family sporulation protein [Aneurinibacillus sp. Ricciae_BoGa-3]WCK56237.1 YjcZ family sporulation protein [Aneurinibacillus sp. Ricciae_BoGa-3]